VLSTERPRRIIGAALLAVLLGACSGGGGSGDGGRAGGDEDRSYEIAAKPCDPIRGAGTITNRAGEPAAFVVQVKYDYADGDVRPFQTTTTPVLADGESFDFSAGPDPTGGTPSSCTILGAERVEADQAEVAEVEDREAARPTGEATSETVSPLWTQTGINGSVRVVALHDGVGFLASDLPGGSAIFSIDAEDGSLIWEIEADLRWEALIPDGRGGVLAVSGNLLVSFDDEGEQRWSERALLNADSGGAGTVDHVVVDGDLVVAGGSAPGALAGLDLDTGEQRWYVHQDEALDDEPIGFGGASDHLSISDHGLLVAGGTPSLRHLVLFDLGGDDPEVVWSVPDAGQNLASDGDVAVNAVGDTVTAYDVATGDELWSVSDESWERAAPADPAIVEDVVIVSRGSGTVALDLTTGEQRWADPDLAPAWTTIGGEARIGDAVFGMVGPTHNLLIAADGSTVEVEVDEAITGTVDSVATEDGRVLLAARGSTSRQPSTAWVLDLAALGG